VLSKAAFFKKCLIEAILSVKNKNLRDVEAKLRFALFFRFTQPFLDKSEQTTHWVNPGGESDQLIVHFSFALKWKRSFVSKIKVELF